MKALTVRQPWADLIVSGAKTIETRGWAAQHRGPLLIHAGRRFGPCEPGWPLTHHLPLPWVLDPRVTEPDPRGWTPAFGAIVGSVTLMACLPIIGPPEDLDDVVEPAVIVDGSRATIVQLNGDESDVSEQLALGDFGLGRVAWLFGAATPTGVACPMRSHHTRNRRCVVCQGHDRCAPIPAIGRQAVWEWNPYRERRSDDS